MTKDCECARCRKERGEIFRTRMYVCPICGNKRCPHIEWHRYKCTNSNDLNQVGIIADEETSIDIECVKNNLSN